MGQCDMKVMKDIGRTALFLAILAAVTVSAFRVLAWKDSGGIAGLYDSAPDTADVLLVGSSHSYCAINTQLLWEDYGIAALDISESGQTFAVTYRYLVEALKTQRPKVVFVELFKINSTFDSNRGNLYRNTLNMKWSANFLDNLKSALRRVEVEGDRASGIAALQRSIALKFPVFHTRYRELTEADFSAGEASLRYSANWSRKAYATPEAARGEGVATLSKAQRDALEGMVALSREYGFQLVFWVAPHVFMLPGRIAYYNAVAQFAAQNGARYISFFDLAEEIGFDFETDMRDEELAGSHVNSDGAAKITAYVGRLLSESGDLPDRRGDPRYARYEQLDRLWRVEAARHELQAATDAQAYADALDHDLFRASVLYYGSKATRPKDLIREITHGAKHVAKGLFTRSKRDGINKSWALSGHVRLTVGKKSIREAALYEDAEAIGISDCDLCVIVVDKADGRLVDVAEFNLSGDSYLRL